MNEVEFAYRIRQALNEATEQLEYRIVFRLERARTAALARVPRENEALAWAPAVLAPAGGPSISDQSARGIWLQRLGLLVPLAALLIGFVAIYEWQHARRINELADLDFAVLLDEAPIDAYADKGFGALLRNEQ